jgi:hypothetical protein
MSPSAGSITRGDADERLADTEGNYDNGNLSDNGGDVDRW